MAAPDGRTFGQETLDQTVFETVERHRDQTAAGFQHPLGSGEATFDLPQLVIDGDAQGLKGPRCRIRCRRESAA